MREANLDALVRPYPKLTAGTPIEWHYDVAAHRFTYRWDTGRADRGGRFPDGSVTAISTPPGRTLAVTTLKSSVAVSFPRRVRPSSRSRRARGAAEVSIVVELGDGPAQQGC